MKFVNVGNTVINMDEVLYYEPETRTDQYDITYWFGIRFYFKGHTAADHKILCVRVASGAELDSWLDHIWQRVSS